MGSVDLLPCCRMGLRASVIQTIQMVKFAAHVTDCVEVVLITVLVRDVLTTQVSIVGDY